VAAAKGNSESPLLQGIVVTSGNHQIAFMVDEVIREQEILVKPLGPQLQKIANIAGATIVDGGSVVPVLNVSDLVKSATRSSQSNAVAAPAERTQSQSAILVAEDSITSRTLLKSILETAGYEVETAVDGVDAYTKLKAGQFDLVVSDVDMPRLNGFGLTAKVRADKRLAETPVILITALDSRSDREHGIDVGANAYIVKSSFDQGHLLEVIRRLL
jgi:two-component system chemotaxis sensor kinase CheA